MTAASLEPAETGYDCTLDHPQSFRWVEQGFVFEIVSSDRNLLEMARRVFSAPSPAATDLTTRSWRIERLQSEVAGTNTWQVSGSSDKSSMLPVRADSRENAILHVEQDALEWLLNNFDDAIAVHAALLSKGGKGVVIVGPSLAGKSTLATALWRNGWSLMSDDIVFIDSAQRTASPAPRRVSLRFGSRELVGDSTWNEISRTPSCIETWKGLFFHPHELSGLEKERSTNLSAIFFLARIDTLIRPAEVREINSAKASLSFLPYAFNARTLPFVEGLRRVTPLLDMVPAYDLGRGDLQAMINAVEAAIV